MHEHKQTRKPKPKQMHKPEQRHRLCKAFLGGKLKRLRKPEPHRRPNISKHKPEQRHRLWQAFLGLKLKRLRKPEPHRRPNISKL